MKQLIQNIKNGQTSLADVPRPALRPGGILVRSEASLISAGTERMMLKLAKKSLLGKARERPDLVKKVLDKVRRDGLLATFETVRRQLDRDVAVGYSLCGRVEDVGAQACEFSMGQRVACAGAGYANHAEVNYVPRLLAARVPEGVSSEAAAYTTVGAIALQGIRNADVRLGETVAVIGLGLLGQLSVQILRASGCRVVGIDVSKERAELAARFGAELALTSQDPVEECVEAATRGRGVDAILITAATASNAPIELAARIARDRARVVMVGVTGMEIPRKPYFEKELTFLVSRSYGPGRYDPQYEEHGHDYPAGYVRWTEQRNLEAFLDLVAAGTVRPEPLTTHHFAIGDAEQAFELILTGREPYLGVVLTYPQPAEKVPEPVCIPLKTAPRPSYTGKVRVSFLGAGSFAQSVLLPNLAKLPQVEFRGVATASGLTARSAGKKFGFAYCTSSTDEILGDDQTDLVFIATRHSQHAELVCRALDAGKAVFVEKPLAISLEQLAQIRQTLVRNNPGLMVGFNRRFGPLAAKLKTHLAGRGPLTVHYRCNAGKLPPEHWLSDPAEGGRIIGEACHFFDFFAYLTDARPTTVFASSPGPGANPDDAQVLVRYDDGSVCHLNYTTSGPASYSKERIEAFAGGNVGVLDDFRTLYLESANGKRHRQRLFRPDKGHGGEMKRLVDAVRESGRFPIAAASLIETTAVALAARESVQRGVPTFVNSLLIQPAVDDSSAPVAAVPQS